jgi:hypothetical protein
MQNNYPPGASNSEVGVYVLSTEFFSISVINQWQPPIVPLNGNHPNTNPPVKVPLNGNGAANPQGNSPPINPVPPNQGGTSIPSQAVLVLKRISN